MSFRPPKKLRSARVCITNHQTRARSGICKRLSIYDQIPKYLVVFARGYQYMIKYPKALSTTVLWWPRLKHGAHCPPPPLWMQISGDIMCVSQASNSWVWASQATHGQPPTHSLSFTQISQGPLLGQSSSISFMYAFPTSLSHSLFWASRSSQVTGPSPLGVGGWWVHTWWRLISACNVNALLNMFTYLLVFFECKRVYMFTFTRLRAT